MREARVCGVVVTDGFCPIEIRRDLQLIGFSIAGDFIALERGSERFDLHNSFVFQGLSYNSAQRTLELNWRRDPGQSAKPSDPLQLSLVFSGVHLFKARERDPTIPFTEDDCLDLIGFIWDDLLAQMGGITSNSPGEGCTHLTATFMSGFSIKVGAESLALRSSGGA